jgi:hypothetical protein
VSGDPQPKVQAAAKKALQEVTGWRGAGKKERARKLAKEERGREM